MRVMLGKLDYLSQSPNVRIFTGNPVITKAGKVVMGAGAAKAVRDGYVGIDSEFAKQLRSRPNANLLYVDTPRGCIGWLKVKHHWKDNADLQLIYASLVELAATAKANKHVEFDVNMPGIGNGGLPVELVSGVLLSADLPNNVTVWTTVPVVGY